MTLASPLSFPRSWEAEILPRRPLILPPGAFTYPRDAEEVERGALEVMVRPEHSSPFLATFALGFADPSTPTGVWSCPAPNEICAVAGGYAYIVNTIQAAQFTHIAFRPVLEVLPVPEHRLLLFAGHHALLAWGIDGPAWQTQRLSSEGLRITEIRNNELHGCGWDQITDRELPFIVDLRTGQSSDPHSDSVR